MFNLDINPYETDDEREARLVAEFEAAKQAQASRELEQLSRLPAGTDEALARVRDANSTTLPPRAQAALAAYVPPTAGDVTAGKIRTRPEAPAEMGELGVTAAPRFDPLPNAAPAVALPPGTNEALERTSSNLRVPERAPLNHSAGTGAMLNRLDANVARDAELKMQSAETKAAGHEREAVAYGEAAQAGEAGLQETLARREEALARKDASIKEAYAALKRTQSALGTPPDTSKGRTLQIVGAIMSMGNAGVGRGLSMLGEMMNDDVQAWQRGIEGNEAIRKAMMQMADMEDGSVESELRQQQSISNLWAANTANTLRQIAAETERDDVRSVAEQLAIQTENKAIEFYVDRNDRLALASQRGSGAGDSAAQKEMMLTSIMRGLKELPEDQRISAAQSAGPLGVEALGLLRKADGKDESGAPKMTDGDKKLARLAEGVRPAYDTLSKRATELQKRLEAGEDPGDFGVPYIGIGPDASETLATEETQALNQDIMQLADVLLRDESGAVLGDNEQRKKWKSWGLLSPDAKIRNRGLGKMLAEFEGRTAAVSPAAPAGADSTAAEGPTLVRMRAPSGRSVTVPAHGVQAAKDKGYRIETTAGTTGSF